ncbi:MAG: sigma-70 family RNA polymerase sigma factor [Xanthobacteraceae bacterium]|jgi:RNA polymerase sigma-70 factor (ECF subfamily)
MSEPGEHEAVEGFEPHRRRLTGLAYRMLGSLTEAEDIVQEAFLRWHAVDRATVADPRAYLSRVVARLCLDQLKSARVRRETYVGPWLPEPVIDAAALAPDTASEYADDLSVALLLTLERLSPLERAAFLLHDVFEVDFPEVARALDRSEAACRQLAARARAHVRQSRPRFAATDEDVARLTDAFHAAVLAGDVPGLAQLLAEDAVLYSDGGGKRSAALNPIRGRDKIIRFYVGLARKRGRPKLRSVRQARINGMPGFIIVDGEGEVETLALDIRDRRIAALYLVRNPDKLVHGSVLHFRQHAQKVGS